MNLFLDKQCRDYSNHETTLNSVQIEARQKHIPKWQFDTKKMR